MAVFEVAAGHCGDWSQRCGRIRGIELECEYSGLGGPFLLNTLGLMEFLYNGRS